MRKLAILVLGCLSVFMAGTANATLSGTLVEAKDPWYQPIWTPNPYVKYEPLSNSISIGTYSVPIVMSAWWYGTYANVGCTVRVKINGSVYVQSTFLTTAGKQIIPNMNVNWDVPESAFDFGDNVLEYELVVDPAYTITQTTFYYKFNVTRS